jgi:hypothetical protein
MTRRTDTNVPCSLIVGEKESCHNFVLQELKFEFCSTSGHNDKTCSCLDCKKILQRKHHSIVWIEPEGKYVLQDLQVIFDRGFFALEENESFVFVLTQAHLLGDACSNKLLKVLEEPCRGYKFFLIANNENLVISTIRSRCILMHVNSKLSSGDHPIVTFFRSCQGLDDQIGFSSELEKLKPSELESVEIMQCFLTELFEKYSKISLLLKNQATGHESKQKLNYIEELIEFVQAILDQPPQSGSAAFFLKKAFLSFPKNKVFHDNVFA